MDLTAFVRTSPPPSPSARFATPTDALATFRLASAAARPTRAGAVAAEAILWAKFILEVYSRRNPGEPCCVQAVAMIPGRMFAETWHLATRLYTITTQETSSKDGPHDNGRLRAQPQRDQTRGASARRRRRGQYRRIALGEPEIPGFRGPDGHQRGPGARPRPGRPPR